MIELKTNAYCTLSEAETIIHCLFLALVCYDFELDCCLKKALHDCKVWYKKRVLPFVAKTLDLPSNEYLLYEEELVREVVKIEKCILVEKEAFVQKQKEIASMETNLSQAKAQVEGLNEEIEGFGYEARMANKVLADNKYPHFVQIQRLREENRALKDILYKAQRLEEEMAEAQDDDLFV